MNSAAYEQVQYAYPIALVQSKHCLCRFVERCPFASTYFKPRDGFPDPEGPLSRAMDSKVCNCKDKKCSS